ncbi:MAG TPA: cupin domain-containing protein [Aggregatilineaceae bacterium]|nr:cupin domain-containing protein [Aggregatilineaceae bacterium]
MPDYHFFDNLVAAIPDLQPDSIISRTLYTTDQLKVIMFGFAPGQELSEHTSVYSAALYFVQGDADITLGGDHLEAHAGTWAHMPPQMPHSVVARTPVIMLLLMFTAN